MNKREKSIFAILSAGINLFRAQGFAGTTVRQLAEEAGVSLAMINYHFGSKDQLGAQVLNLIDRYTMPVLDINEFRKDPILYDMASMRTLYLFMLNNGYKEFYLDTLRYDMFFNYLTQMPMILIDELEKIYGFSASEDEKRLYSKYMPYMLEKTVMLKKEEGLFSSTSYDEVPYLICQMSMSHFIPEAHIRARDEKSKEIARKRLAELEPVPPKKNIENFAIEYAEKKETPPLLVP